MPAAVRDRTRDVDRLGSQRPLAEPVSSGGDKHPQASVECRQDVVADLVDRPISVDLDDLIAPCIVIEHRLCLFEVDGDAVSDDRLAVIGALCEEIATLWTRAIRWEVLELHVERALTSDTDPPAGEPGDERGFRDGEVNHAVNAATPRLELFVKRLGLGERPGEAVEEESMRGVRQLEPLDHGLDDELVWDEVTAVHVRPRRDAERRPSTPMLAQQVASRDVRKLERVADHARLGALSRSRCPDQENRRESAQLHRTLRTALLGRRRPGGTLSVDARLVAGQ